MNTNHNPTLIRALGLAASVGVIVFVLGIVAAGFSYPHYSHVDNMISELGGPDAEHPWIQNANFIVFGLTVIGLALALVLDEGKVFAGAILLGMLGLFGTVGEGVVHCDSGCLGKTTEGALHLGSGLIGFVAGVASLFVLARRWKRTPRWQDYAPFTRRCAFAALAGLALFMASGGFEDVDGLAQRIFVAPLLVWVAATGWRLFAGQPSVAISQPERMNLNVASSEQ